MSYSGLHSQKDKIFCNQEAELYKTKMDFIPNKFFKIQIEIVIGKLRQWDKQ